MNKFISPVKKNNNIVLKLVKAIGLLNNCEVIALLHNDHVEDLLCLTWECPLEVDPSWLTMMVNTSKGKRRLKDIVFVHNRFCELITNQNQIFTHN